MNHTTLQQLQQEVIDDTIKAMKGCKASHTLLELCEIRAKLSTIQLGIAQLNSDSQLYCIPLLKMKEGSFDAYLTKQESGKWYDTSDNNYHEGTWYTPQELQQVPECYRQFAIPITEVD